MRGVYLFVAGILVGLAIQTAIARNQGPGVAGLNHVAISVPDLDDAVEFYTQTMGFPEAFRVADDNGDPALVYVQVSANTFVELQPAHEERPPGLNHFGLHVEDMAVATAILRERGADVSGTRTGSTKAILANVGDPNGVRIELLELPADSLTALAIERWHRQ